MAEVVGDAGGEQKPVRLGIIGAGWFVSRRHLPDAMANPKVTVAAICRRDPEARAKIAAHFAIPDEITFGDWRQMLDSVEMDAVLIATPNALHYEQAREALERGLHVLIEKPMTVRSEDAHALVALARARNRKLSVALNPPFWAHCHSIRRALASEKMGALESASLYWTGSSAYMFGRGAAPENLPGVVPPTAYRADPALNGGGYLIDGGSHLISEILWITGLRARRVSTLMDATPLDMRFSLCLELSNGAVAGINSIGDSAYQTRRVRNVFGASGGTITVVGFDFETSITLHGQESQKFRENDLAPISPPVTNFVDAIQENGELFSPGEHGAHVVEVVEAAYESAATGRTITLPGEAAVTAGREEHASAEAVVTAEPTQAKAP